METLEGLPEDIRVPESIPLTKQLLNKFQREAVQLPETPSKSDFESEIDNIVRDVDAYVESHVSEERLAEISIEYIDASAAVVERLYEAYHHKTLYVALNKAAMEEIRLVANEAPDISLSNLKHFQENPTLPFSTILDTYYAQQVTEDTIGHSVARESKLQHLRNLSSVLQNPEDPLPETDSVDDEIAVSGGKVSLKDPISLQFFENPVRSKKCGHTYENRSILLQLRGGGTHCPISGCHHDLLVSDLVPDTMMKLRVQMFKAQQTQRRRTTKLETVM